MPGQIRSKFNLNSQDYKSGKKMYIFTMTQNIEQNDSFKGFAWPSQAPDLNLTDHLTI